MERIHLEKWLLEVDLKKTIEFYNKDMDLCHCLYCENFMEASKQNDPYINSVFTRLGIDPSKPVQLSEFGKTEEGLRYYMGSYHLVGELAEGSYCTDSEWNENNTAKIGSFTFGFNKEVVFVDDDFPQPRLQLDFEIQIPWVLDEEPED